MIDKLQFLRCLTRFFILTLLCGSPAWADDTEIFFSPVSRVEAQPNILLLLDASESMNRYDCANGRRVAAPCNDGSAYGNVTRLQRMTDAIVEIINQATEVNIGLMRYSNTQSGGRVIYPVRNIDLEFCDGVPCTAATEHAGTRTTVRQELIDTLQAIKTQWATPTTGGLLEAYNYYSGLPVQFGKTRWTPSAADHSEQGQHSRVSHPDSYTGGTLNQSGECTDADLSHDDCADENISGDPVYISPIANECQSNHLIVLADGETSTDAPALAMAENLLGSCPLYSNKMKCTVELTDYLYNTDLRPNINGLQHVTTHTIGLNLSSNWLRNLSTATRIDAGTEVPGYYEVASTEQLVDAFTSIFNGIDAESTTFVAPTATVDRFSRVSHRNDLYLSLFNPSEDAAWAGNLKRYQLRGVPAELYDANEPPAAVVDPATGQFRATSKSFWSEEADGHDIAIGGAAGELNYATRRAVTYAGSSEQNLFHEDNTLSTTNPLLAYNDDPNITNLAPSGTATQSSQAHNGAPGRAIDGNTNGNWRRGSITHTQNQVQPWWQLQLPTTTNINEIVLHNRTDCCTSRLTDVYVFVSETPFGNATLDELIANNDIWHQFLPGVQGQVTNLNVNTRGGYVRVQLAGNQNLLGTLSLAEVQVIGGDISAERIEKQQILEWALGRDVKDADEDGDTDDNRFHMGDPLHSNPVTVTYGGTAADPDSVVFVGTNEGYLHAINSRDGSEQFAFMPEELIDNLRYLYNNDTSLGRIYGMDGGLTLWTNDADLDGHIESSANEHAYLYAGMRRGGSSYYALDVSDRDAPLFKWQINGGPGGTTGFGELGETWSKMVPTTIKYGNTTKKVLIFGGGYDNTQDDKTVRSADSVGRAVYIADAETGELLWSGGAGDHNETRSFDDMIYSIPATPKAVDLDGDGAVEQIYVGDMGGQIWRFDIDVFSNTLEVDGGVIADLGTDGIMADTRRFYHTPDVSISVIESEIIVNIAIGSGYQAHPLNTTIDDRFYLIRYPLAYMGEGNYGIPTETPSNNAAGAVVSYEAITEADLYVATDNLIGEGTVEQQKAARLQLAEASGWMIELENRGEKVLGSSTTFNNQILFTSYIPGDGSDPCSPHIGEGAFWAVNLLDATPAEDFIEEDDGLFSQDRNKKMASPGLPPAPQTLIVNTAATDADTQQTTQTQIVTMSGVNKVLDHDVRDLIQRTYWSEYPNF